MEKTEMKKVYARPSALLPMNSGYCPGCMHSGIAKVIGRVLDDLQQTDNTLLVLPVGCSTMATLYFRLDMVVAAHGRAPAVATGVKRCAPDQLCFTYQGDGDLAAIGLAEILSAANRGEHFTVIFVNNSIYGMTGGQMAPTTLVGQKTTTSIYGRDPGDMGYPLHMCELISQLSAPYYIERVAMDSPLHVRQAEKAIKHAFEIQLEGKGFSFVEILSTCPTNWGLSPQDSIKYITTTTSKEFPLGVFRDKSKEKVES